MPPAKGYTPPRTFPVDPDAPWVRRIMAERATVAGGEGHYRTLWRVGRQGWMANARQADLLAVAAGFHPCELWPQQWFPVAAEDEEDLLVTSGRA